MRLMDQFNETIDSWIAALCQYSFADLCATPSTGQWSLGQLYLHLVQDTGFYIEQIRVCTSNPNNETETMTAAGRQLVNANSFPDQLLTGGPANDCIPQPVSKEQLLQAMTELKKKMNEAADAISTALYKGKTMHPGFGFLHADEWLQFAEMHMRHHWRQRKRIDDFLRGRKG